jgi:hypothetical protein
VHRYGEANEIAKFKEHIESTRRIADGRPIWVTEFLARGTDDEVSAFLNDALPWMDNSTDIQRYAYFMAAPGILINPNGDGLSALGELYNTMKTANDTTSNITPSSKNAPNPPETHKASKRYFEARASEEHEDESLATREIPLENGTSVLAPNLTLKVDATGVRWKCYRCCLFGHCWTCICRPYIGEAQTENLSLPASAAPPAQKRDEDPPLETSSANGRCGYGMVFWPCPHPPAQAETHSLAAPTSTPATKRTPIPDTLLKGPDYVSDLSKRGLCHCCPIKGLRCHRCDCGKDGAKPDKASAGARDAMHKFSASHDTDDVSKMFSPDEMEKQGCRFATWGWVCDEAPKGVEGGDKEAEDELLALGLDLSALGEVGSDGKNVERET